MLNMFDYVFLKSDVNDLFNKINQMQEEFSELEKIEEKTRDNCMFDTNLFEFNKFNLYYELLNVENKVREAIASTDKIFENINSIKYFENFDDKSAFHDKSPFLHDKK